MNGNRHVFTDKDELMPEPFDVPAHDIHEVGEYS
jgi:hypothetical protein